MTQKAQVLVPIPITNAMITASNVAEPDTTRGELLWSPGTNYTIGNEVIRADTHRVYTALASGIDAGLPEATPLRWKDTRPTNKFAAFDNYRSTAIKKAGTLNLTLKPGVMTGMQFFGLVGDVMTLTCKDATTGVPYFGPQDISLSTYLTGDLEWNFWFGTPRQQDVLRITNLVPHDAQVEISLTVSALTGTAEIGIWALGFFEDLGLPKLGWKASPTSTSYVDIDKTTGEAVIVKGISSNNLAGDCYLPSAEAQAVFDVVCQVLGTPCAWVISDQSGSSYLSAFGLGNATISAPGKRETNLSLTVEGLI